jgi:hypothetical protein
VDRASTDIASRQPGGNNYIGTEFVLNLKLY